MPVATAGYIFGVSRYRTKLPPGRDRGSNILLALRRHLRLVLMLAAVLAAAAPAAVRAQGKLEARYSATLAGIPIGKGSWVVDITETKFMAAATGATSGLLRAFTGGQGTGSAHGTLHAGEPMTSIYASTIVTSKKSDDVRLTVANGVVTESRLDPPLETEPDRVPITDEHRKGIIDPMTASLIRAPGTGDPLTQDACQRTMAIFDGRLRYDLQFAFKRIDHVKADKGYAGPVVVCAVYFSPVAGYVPARAAIRYVAKLRDMEVWLAPIAGTRVLVPFRMQGPTPIGRFVVEATQFVTAPITTRASSNGLKTQ